VSGPQEWVYGIHPVTELIERRPQSIARLYTARTSGGQVAQLLRSARRNRVPVSHISAAVLGRKLPRGVAHQGVAALVSPISYLDPDDLCRSVSEEPNVVLLLADRIVDPGNLGALIRTAAAVGVAGLLLSADETVGVTSSVAKVAAGQAERLPIARESKPARRVETLNRAGFRSVLLDPRGDSDWDRADLTGPLLLVAGGEERGVRPAVLKACQLRVRIPLAPGVESLNVAMATGVLLFEALRQRRSRPGSP